MERNKKHRMGDAWRKHWKKQLRLFEVLFRQTKEQKDEYSSRQMEKGNYYMAALILVLGIALAVMYLNDTEINKTQFAAMFYTLFTLFFAGRVFLTCVMGTLPVSDRYGGRCMFIIGMLAVLVQGSLAFPTRHYFGGILFFWDMGLAGVVLYYLACNAAWRSWENYQTELDAAAEAEEREEAEKCEEAGSRAKAEEHAAVNENQARNRWRTKSILAGAVLAAAIGIPSILGFQVYSTEVMEAAKAGIEAAEEAGKTPEFLEYEAYQKLWQEPDTYAMVYKIPLQAEAVADKAAGEGDVTAQAQAGVLYIRTETKEMSLWFAPEEGTARLLYGSYHDYEEKDYSRAEYIYAEGRWYTREDIMVKQSEPDFVIPETPGDWFAAGRIHFPGVKALGNITKEQEPGGIRYTFHYSEEYLKKIENVYLSGKVLSEYQSLLIDEYGTPVEQESWALWQMDNMVNLVKHEWKEVRQQAARYYTREKKEAEELMQKFLEGEIQVPEEAVELYLKIG